MNTDTDYIQIDVITLTAPDLMYLSASAVV